MTFFVGGNADETIDAAVFVVVVEAFTAITSIFARSDLAHATTSAWSLFGDAVVAKLFITESISLNSYRLPTAFWGPSRFCGRWLCDRLLCSCAFERRQES